MTERTTLTLVADRSRGRRLGKYEVLCRLSTGGMAEIFLAFQRGLAGFRKLVVLKQILPDIKAEEEIVRMFLDEAKITAAFNHPNIAQVFDLDTADGELFLAMEFVQGATLIDIARACRQSNEEIPIGFSAAAVRDTALALHYAHTFKDTAGRQRAVIHRDVAEKNIMVTYEGTTKLLDFGIAKAAGRVTRTAVGKVKGTSGYMSPEQVRGLELDARSDIFSLGVVLHECLTGMRLFYGKDAEEGMLAALSASPEPPSASNPEVTPELDAVTMKALARERNQRFGTALEFARALERAAVGKLWHPEQSGELVLRHFADRRQQTHDLLESSGLDKTGEIAVVLPDRDRNREKEREREREREKEQERRPAPAPARPAGYLPPPPLRDLARGSAGVVMPRPPAQGYEAAGSENPDELATVIRPRRKTLETPGVRLREPRTPMPAAPDEDDARPRPSPEPAREGPREDRRRARSTAPVREAREEAADSTRALAPSPAGGVNPWLIYGGLGASLAAAVLALLHYAFHLF